ncbi:hypothetical protein LLS1_31510 [Leifsonia sp. LS1]|uniref:GntR family transcriptional regulator n=1 Tax=Leifsonia sp. LS1 TaxID=2828483 RepID=UPI001CFCD3EF|nr:GntR family transcriptional regulator [Leifsonia sp. LS1]GIT81482.1 hypothetical protein LLS1_31510 [Leifsonia sp. LS1]
MPTSVAPAPRRALVRDIALSKLLAAIAEGDLLSGERLVDAGIEAWLGMSYTPVREAIAQLSLGLVETRSRSATRVTPVDTTRLRTLTWPAWRAEIVSRRLRRVATSIPAAHTAFLASGYGFPNALGVSVLASSLRGPLLLTTGRCIPVSELQFMFDRGVDDFQIVGGENVQTTEVRWARPC